MKKTFFAIAAVLGLVITGCTSDSPTAAQQDSTFVLTVDNLQGDINDGIVTLDPSQTYTLTGGLIVRAGATLVIPAGTTIKTSTTAETTSLFIAVERNAKININGTAAKPVVMTSGKTSPAQSDWGGLIICGNGKVNTGDNGTSEVGGLSYGGTDNSDSSGNINFLKIMYTGSKFSPTKEYNGVSFFGVGSGTTVSNIYTFESGDDGIEFFGGAVNPRYLIALHSEDDAVDFADGFSGTIDYVFIKDVAKAGVEGSNNGDNGAATPTTNATLKNFTILKGSLAGSEHGMYLKEGTGKWNCQNIYIDGFTKGLKINSSTADANSNLNVDNGFVTFNPIYFGATITTQSEYAGTNTTYLTVGTNTGAGNSGETPSWATGWTTGF